MEVQDRSIVFQIDQREFSLFMELLRQAEALINHPTRPKQFLAKAVKDVQDYRESIMEGGI